MSEECNGWKNYETWNVALMLCGDEGLYNFARAFKRRGYKALIKELQEDGILRDVTSDGVSWTGPTLDFDTLDEMLQEL